MYRVAVTRVTVLLAVATLASGTAGDSITRQTHNGDVMGEENELAQVFKGIPYAKQPGRWEKPVPAEPWAEPLDATLEKPMCYQPDSACQYPLGTVCLSQKSEDCLFLNIFAPLGTTSNDRKDVLVFMHGGFFQGFTPHGETYNMDVLASLGDIIGVTMSYRLGAFGFFITDLGEENGNYGQMDQRLALKWVKENIEFFGGDPSQITLGGDSAGALSAILHMSSPSSTVLFHQVALLSPPIGIPLKSKSEAVAQGQALTTVLNCDASDRKCLKNISADDINAAMDMISFQGFMSPRENFFKEYMPLGPYVERNILEKGYPPRNTFIGTALHETTGLVPRFNPNDLKYSVYEYLFKRWKPTNFDDITKHYGIVQGYDYEDLRPKVTYLMDDIIFNCPVRQLARKLERRDKKVFKYVFEQYDYTDNNDELSCDHAACHGNDLASWFGKHDSGASDEDKQLSTYMMTYLTNFVKHGDPNIESDIQSWPQYESTYRTFMQRFTCRRHEDMCTLNQNLVLKNPSIYTKKNYNQYDCDKWDQWGVLDSIGPNTT